MYPTFLEPYDKIIYLRKKYKITQQELADGFYSQAYITKLETKRQPPTIENLQFFACRLNRIFKERKLKEVVCYKELKKSKKESIDEYYNKTINEVRNIDKNSSNKKNSFDKIIGELRIYENHLSVSQKLELFKEVYEKAFEIENYYIAKTYSFNFILETIFLEKVKEMQDGLLTLTRSCILSKDYNYIYELQNLVEPYFPKFKSNKKEIIYMNLGTIALRLENYKVALQYFDKIDNEIQIQKSAFHKEINKAIIYRRLGEYKKAEKIYLNLIKRKDKDEDIIIWTKTNLLTLYREANDYESLRKNYYFVKKHITTHSSKHLKTFLYTLAISALALNKKKDAMFFFHKTLGKSKSDFLEEEELNLNYECIKNLLNLYKKKDLIQVEELQKNYFEIFPKLKNSDIGYEFVKYYSNFKFYEQLKDFLILQQHHF